MKKFRKTRRLCLILCGLLLLLCFSGCADEQTDGKTVLSVDGMPAESDEENHANFMSTVEKFEAENPDVTLEPRNWGYAVDTFLPQAASNQIPTVYGTFFTEVSKIIDAGFAADITDYYEKYGYADTIRPEILDMVQKDGKVYMIPSSAYMMGLYINLDIFEEAGLLNEDGTAKIPQTFEELAETAQLIHERTGKVGFAFPTTNNYGGWHFMNIAWAYGTEFMKQENGKWIATFDSPECAAALQYLKDLKWEYNAMSANTLLSPNEALEMYASGQAAMTFDSPPRDILTSRYGMSKDSISVGRIPAGPAGRFAVMGGNLKVIRDGATPEEMDAAFRWFEAIGISPNLTDTAKEHMENEYKTKAEQGDLVAFAPYDHWADNSEYSNYRNEMIEKYRNADEKYFKEYVDAEGVTVRAEEPVACQELYQVLDNCIQEVLNNQNADVNTVLAEAAQQFQVNYLDKEE